MLRVQISPLAPRPTKERSAAGEINHDSAFKCNTFWARHTAVDNGKHFLGGGAKGSLSLALVLSEGHSGIFNFHLDEPQRHTERTTV